MPKLIDITGKRFGRLLVIGRDNTLKKPKWFCKCDCGNEVFVASNYLRNGVIKSCKCLQKELSSKRAEKLNLIHGHARHKRSATYKSWRSMHQRCTNPAINGYHNYGGRGIKVTERWTSFENFLLDMGTRPLGKTLDRKDNDKDYTPSNCKWSTLSEQAKNRRGRA